MLVGYARVSTEDQNLDMQLDALRAAGCEKIFTEKMSGAGRDRPQLNIALAFIKEGDTFVVWKSDRVVRSLKHLLQIVDELHAKGASFKSLTEPFDTAGDIGKFMLQIFGAIAELERNIIKARCRSGIVAAKSRGVKFGRTEKIANKAIEAVESRMNDDPDFDMTKTARDLGVHRNTLYRRINDRRRMARAKIEHGAV